MAAASTAGPRQPSTMLSSQSKPQTPSQSCSAAMPEQMTGLIEPEQAEEGVAEHQSASSAITAECESAQQYVLILQRTASKIRPSLCGHLQRVRKALLGTQ